MTGFRLFSILSSHKARIVLSLSAFQDTRRARAISPLSARIDGFVWLERIDGSVFWFCSLLKLKESLDLVVVQKRQEKKVAA